MKWIKRLLYVLAGIAVIAAVVISFLPKAVPVDVATIDRVPLKLTVDEEGITRLRERYVVSTPLAGRLERIVLDVGDRVEAGKTELALLEPTAPQLLDPRDLAMTQARVKAAEGRLRRSEAELQRVRTELELAQKEYLRIVDLHQRGATTDVARDQAESIQRTRSELERSALFAVEIAQYELEQEQAALVHTSQFKEGTDSESNPDPNFEFRIVSPISGRVLRIVEESSGVLGAGAPLLEVGDPSDLEVVIDVLSSDAVRISPGQQVILDRWGGATPLPAIVRLVEPSGFRKISALGVEEQRVNVILDFTGSSSQRDGLGDGFRVEAKIVVWQEDDVLSVPIGSLFRLGADWAVFVDEQGIAKERRILLGVRNSQMAQVLEGLKEGERVILHPSDQIQDGIAIELRPE